MSDVASVTLAGKNKRKTKKIIYDSDDESSGNVVVEKVDDKSVASEDSSSTHSYEDYAESYRELQREVDLHLQKEDSVDGITLKSKVSTPFISTDVELSVEKEQKIDKTKMKKGKNEGEIITYNISSDVHYKISQLEQEINVLKIAQKNLTVDRAYNLLMVNIDGLSTAQKKALINAVISTMK
uniref:NSP5 n=1 Tax=Crocidura shantungensis seadorna-like virus 2 TaxID=3139546 RepID=A0AB38ZK49_9REOV